jgi:hypothetical protein
MAVKVVSEASNRKSLRDGGDNSSNSKEAVAEDLIYD